MANRSKKGSSDPYGRSASLSVRFFPFGELTPSGPLQGRELQGCTLVVSRYAGIAIFHGSIMALTFDPCKPLKMRGAVMGHDLPIMALNKPCRTAESKRWFRFVQTLFFWLMCVKMTIIVGVLNHPNECGRRKKAGESLCRTLNPFPEFRANLRKNCACFGSGHRSFPEFDGNEEIRFESTLGESRTA